jgi:hypothetical protein
VFLKLDNIGANLVARTIQPIVGPTADQNFLDTLKFIQRLNETAVENGPGVQHMAWRLNIEEQTREKFIEATGNVYAKATSQSISAQQNLLAVPTLTVNPNQSLSSNGVGKAGYSYLEDSQTQVQGRNSSFRPSDIPIPAFPPSRHTPPNYQSGAFSR